MTKKNSTTSEEKIKQNRRSFLRKMKYAAPTLVALGALTKPTNSKAAPPSAPTW